MIIARTLIVGAALLVMGGCSSSDSSSPTTPPEASGLSALAPAPNVASIEKRSRELVLHVEDLTCEGCAWQIRETLQAMDGVNDVRTTVADKRVVVTYDPRKASPATTRLALEQVGYQSEEILQRSVVE